MTIKRMKIVFIISFILPTLLLYSILTVYPIVKGLYISLFDWSGGSLTKDFVGMRNFRDIFQDPIIPKAIFNDYFLVFWKVLGIMLLAVFFAVALTRFNIKESKFLKVIFFFPNVISIVVIGVLWRFIYNPSLGFLNSFLSKLQGKPVEILWLGDSKYALWSLLPPSVWAGIGLYMLLLIASITSIPNSLYEAAEIDGASQWQQFLNVTLPLIWEQIKVCILSIVMSTLNGSFVMVAIMTKGGPDNSTQVMGHYLYQMGFEQYHMGYAAAIGVLILLISLITIVLLQLLMKREIVEVA